MRCLSVGELAQLFRVGTTCRVVNVWQVSFARSLCCELVQLLCGAGSHSQQSLLACGGWSTSLPVIHFNVAAARTSSLPLQVDSRQLISWAPYVTRLNTDMYFVRLSGARAFISAAARFARVTAGCRAGLSARRAVHNHQHNVFRLPCARLRSIRSADVAGAQLLVPRFPS